LTYKDKYLFLLMNIKPYGLTLDDDIVIKVKEKLSHSGGKLSTLVNQLLKEWVEGVKDGS